LWLILIGLTVSAAIVALVLYAFHGNIVLFLSPTQVMAGETPAGRAFRVGGVVKAGSVRRQGGEVAFVVTDGESDLPVRYQGILPDLFREGKGAVVQGRIGGDGAFFIATEVLAKHDENYTPPEAAPGNTAAAVEAVAKTLRAP
jgi:cytochrome c-type biogenesis protein CcmE